MWLQGQNFPGRVLSGRWGPASPRKLYQCQEPKRAHRGAPAGPLCPESCCGAESHLVPFWVEHEWVRAWPCAQRG